MEESQLVSSSLNDDDVASSKSGGNKRTSPGDDHLPHATEELPRKRPKSSDGRAVAPIRSEYLANPANNAIGSLPPHGTEDDAAEASQYVQQERKRSAEGKPRARGQNTNRTFGFARDAIELCVSRTTCPEFSPRECKFGDGCKFEHDLRRYLAEKAGDLATFGGRCPVWAAHGVCHSGWKCRFVGSHMEEREREDGRKELVLTEDSSRGERLMESKEDVQDVDLRNVISTEAKFNLSRRRIQTTKADLYIRWLDTTSAEPDRQSHEPTQTAAQEHGRPNGASKEQAIITAKDLTEDNRAQYREPPLLPSEKRRLYFGPDTPVLAPLTTQGNLPFRRLCVELGAQVTYSEMAMSLPLIQGSKSEWALLRAHRSEVTPPVVREDSPVVEGYQRSRDLKFGAQIAAAKPWQAIKATEILTTLCPHLRVIDLNCGCPIDMIYRAGAGSALLDSQAKLEKMLHGMNAVSGDVPISVKLRMGTKDAKPTALKLARRLVFGAQEDDATRSGVAAITLHGRSRQQRYTKTADWEYISECAALIKRITTEQERVTDTVREEDPRTRPAAGPGKVFFIGNGDCYSHVDYYDHLHRAGVDSVMIGRGALIKPWIFEEIHQHQFLDKSASERLAYVERFARYGLDTWGSDEIGVSTTRRFLLEWLSFAYRYVPVGILERLPPRIQDRPPQWHGRNDLETLLGSGNYKDWMKICEMFLGPAHKDFRYEPKNRSNAYDAEAEG